MFIEFVVLANFVVDVTLWTLCVLW